jgi:hypothetical protein
MQLLANATGSSRTCTTARDPAMPCAKHGFPRQRGALAGAKKKARKGIAVPGQLLQAFARDWGRERTPADILGHRSNPFCTIPYISRNIFPAVQAKDAGILSVHGGLPVPGGRGARGPAQVVQ